MRSELNELAHIDSYLLKQLNEAETHTFETSLLVDSAFAEKVEAQRISHRLIRLYARTNARQRLENIYQQLLNEPAFANQLKPLL